MPFERKERGTWRGQVTRRGKTHVRDFPTRQEAAEWEEQKRRELSEQMEAPSQINIDEAKHKELDEMLRWWRKRKNELTTDTCMESRPPVFKRGSDTVVKSVRIGRGLYEDAERWARKHPASSGGTFNSLIELLLWRHLGCASKYVITEDEES